nr:DoxX family protein [Kibdelosporangium sp. MJ126-NF4]CEL13354.1 Membrane protein, distant similarity to thiosulphate:quinone oxidoreductase DoxD [Kibdelosporangium sp. MJ126-NF4]CTQ99044.1 Membrane protein, distant similarity to thiosulphate:quinone oxidoreductase DoxD [Kibdelosporangium sp. MJ126-NF4]
MEVGLLVVRAVVGLVMAYHGTEKLFGWWGADGLDGAARFFGRQGFRPPRLMAAVAGLTETGGGVLLALGLLTPLAALMLVGTFVNIVVLHLPNGLSRRRNGFEYELVLMAATVCVAFTGPGALAVDAVLGVDFAGAAWGAAVVGLGVVSGLAVSATRAKPNAGAAGDSP